MSIFANQRSAAAFQLNPVAAGCALFVAAFAMPAFAQNAPAEEAPAAAQAPIASVVVSGIRRGIEDAISVKKDSNSIVEAISAEDIGKLPDVSIAESISRLPGLSAQRVAGRAQVISVRGLSPDFSTTLLNGREQVSTGDNRSVEFDQYPSELMSGVTVYKTPDAGLVGQGLSGTIDMQTVRPLAFSGRTVALNARGEKNSLGKIGNAKDTGTRFSASYIDQFAGRTIGVALGYARLETPILSNETGLYEPWKRDARNGLPAGTFASNGIKAVARSGRNERDGLMGVLQYRPNKQWTSIVDVYASRFKAEETANQLEISLEQSESNYNPVTVNNGTIAGGTLNNVRPLVRGMYNKRKDDIRAFGWSNEYKSSDWTIFGDVNYSKAKRNETGLENNLQYSNGGASAILDKVNLGYGNGGYSQLTPGLDYSNSNNLYVGNTIYGSGYGKVPSVEDELKGAKLTANVRASGDLEKAFSSFDFGVNYADRSKSKRQAEGAINLVGGPVVVPGNLQYGSVDLGFAGAGSIPTWNVPGFVSQYMSFLPSEDLTYLIPKAWTVNEKVITTFAKANIEAELSPAVSLRGNIGVQMQNTKQSSDSRYLDNTKTGANQIQPIHDGKSYTDILPSMNLAFGFEGQQTVRVALAKQLARPRVDQLRSALEINVDTTKGEPNASGGNAQLDPWRAKAFDISYEKYFDKKAYFAAAAFFKKLDTYIFTQTRRTDFSNYFPADFVMTNGLPLRSRIGDYSAAYNGNGGILKGVELSGSMPLNMLTKTLDGFGVSASATYTDSKITIEDPSGSIGNNIPLPGLSKRTTNLTAYYEKDGFETRVSQRRRSDFVGEIGNFSNDRALRYVVGENIVDFQIGYTFNSGAMKGVGLVLQVNNLRNAAYETYNGDRAQQLEYAKYGRTVIAGMNYKF
ncbi:TonB-dependent receptor [Duganella phyllosphaerae]|uniref:TonB-dependent receptor plug domain protein n=1 Tax=Duganella phyllosphaerae TaxID=762836 RepID=A0A1E7WHI3_9BURK|nr:TonB-dependent receptor [Duganella phyllosphaerae]OEZ98099.1 TonB-dependent receptor plug domain protein [Duganella phyllosphaerae]